MTLTFDSVQFFCRPVLHQTKRGEIGVARKEGVRLQKGHFKTKRKKNLAVGRVSYRMKPSALTPRAVQRERNPAKNQRGG